MIAVFGDLMICQMGDNFVNFQFILSSFAKLLAGTKILAINESTKMDAIRIMVYLMSR